MIADWEVVKLRVMLYEAIDLLQEGKSHSQASQHLQDAYQIEPSTALEIVNTAHDLAYGFGTGKRKRWSLQ